MLFFNEAIASSIQILTMNLAIGLDKAQRQAIRLYSESSVVLWKKALMNP